MHTPLDYCYRIELVIGEYDQTILDRITTYLVGFIARILLAGSNFCHRVRLRITRVCNTLYTYIVYGIIPPTTDL